MLAKWANVLVSHYMLVSPAKQTSEKNLNAFVDMLLALRFRSSVYRLPTTVMSLLSSNRPMMMVRRGRRVPRVAEPDGIYRQAGVIGLAGRVRSQGIT